MANDTQFRKPAKQGQRIHNKSAHELLSEADHDREFKLETALAHDDFAENSEVELSDEEFLRRTRASHTTSILPTPPAIEGFKTCWIPVESKNAYDTIHYRKSVGYSVVKPEELPHFNTESNRSGQFEGCISHGEMILMKLPVRLYNLLMRDAHHIQPNEQEMSIKQNMTSVNDKEGKTVVRDLAEMTGTRSLARKVADPHFT